MVDAFRSTWGHWPLRTKGSWIAKVFPMRTGAHPCVKGLRPRSNQMSFLAGPFQTKLFHSKKDHQTSIRVCSILARDHGNQPCIDLVLLSGFHPWPIASMKHCHMEQRRCIDAKIRRREVCTSPPQNAPTRGKHDNNTTTLNHRSNYVCTKRSENCLHFSV